MDVEWGTDGQKGSRSGVSAESSGNGNCPEGRAKMCRPRCTMVGVDVESASLLLGIVSYSCRVQNQRLRMLTATFSVTSRCNDGRLADNYLAALHSGRTGRVYGAGCNDMLFERPSRRRCRQWRQRVSLASSMRQSPLQSGR